MVGPWRPRMRCLRHGLKIPHEYSRGVLDSFQFESGSVWNHFKRRFFLWHRASHFNIERVRFTDGSAALMIVCSCNVLSDHDVRSAVESAQDLPRNAKQIYGCLGCSAECGRGARTLTILPDEALGACAP